VITAEYLTGCLRRLLDGEDALVLHEVVNSSRAVAEHRRPSRPGSVLHHDGGYLGWAGGAAVGAKLASAERTVVSLVGDGSFLLSVPASAFWVQQRYGTPSLTVIYDNRGWAGPKFSTLHVHPVGAAATADDFHGSLSPRWICRGAEGRVRGRAWRTAGRGERATAPRIGTVFNQPNRVV
jgi:acetolactate synthase I/II/III large subunit